MKKCSSIFFVLLTFLSPTHSFALTLEFPEQKFVLGVPFVSYTKVTSSTNESNTLPIGFAVEYSMFLKSDLSLDGQFEINMESDEQSIVFLGGSGGLKWYYLGGATEQYIDPYIRSIGTPDLNLFVNGGFASRQFDFRVINSKNSTPGKIVVLDEQNAPTGSVFALQLGAGAEYSIFFDLLAGLRFQYLTSFSGQTVPDFSIIEVWFTTGFVL